MKIILVGDGGHGKVVQDIIRMTGQHHLMAILDDRYKELKWTKDRIYKGPMEYATEFVSHDASTRFVITIGDNANRKKIVSKLALKREQYVTLVHPTAIISPTASIGLGSVVMANTVIQSDVHIGNHSLINTGAIIEHDCVLGDYVHIGPNATMTGSVRIEEGGMVGAGTTIIPGQKIAEWAVIGAGATVISEIPAHCTAVGTPARVLQRMKEYR